MQKTVVLNSNHPAIQYLSAKDKRLSKVISMVGEIKYTIHDDGYSFLIHEIIEQMLSVKAGAKIFSRLVDLCDGNITVESVTKLTDEQIKSTGTSNSKVNYIRCVTEAVATETLNLSELERLSDEAVYRKLISIRGIGSWTAKMYLLFVLDRQDILPYEDIAFLQSYKWMYRTNDVTKASVIKKCKKWKPYTSIAARYLYRALDTGLTKEEFHLYKD